MRAAFLCCTPGGERAASVDIFAPDAPFVIPHGLCFDAEGTLFVVEQNCISSFAEAEKDWRRLVWKDARNLAPQGGLVPAAEQSANHTTRVCRVGPDGKLYVALGQPYNVTPREKLELYDRIGMGGLIRMNRDGSGREVFARGIRNSVGLDFDPGDDALWFTDNQVDRMGDDAPPGELNRAPRPGLHFGFPWYGGGHVRTYEYSRDEPPPNVVFPQVEEAPHAADLGMVFYRGAAFPPYYRGGIFSAQHGSWDRTHADRRAGDVHPRRPGGKARRQRALRGGLEHGDPQYLGRPVDVAELPDGSLLVTDDQNGAVYRIGYKAP